MRRPTPDSAGFPVPSTSSGRTIPLALFSFNVGIELGQLVFVAGLLVLGWLLGPRRRRLPAWSSAVPVYGIGTLAAFWTFERLAGL